MVLISMDILKMCWLSRLERKAEAGKTPDPKSAFRTIHSFTILNYKIERTLS